MRLSNLSLSFVAVFLLSSTSEAKKKKKKAEPIFDSKTLKCLVCKSLVEEIEAEIFKVDPSKKVEFGSFRLKPDGTQERKVVSRDAVLKPLIYCWFFFNADVFNRFHMPVLSNIWAT